MTGHSRDARGSRRVDTGVQLTREQASCVLSATWLAANGSPWPRDRASGPDKLQNNDNVTSRSLCSYEIFTAVTQAAERFYEVPIKHLQYFFKNALSCVRRGCLRDGHMHFFKRSVFKLLGLCATSLS